MQVWVPLLEGGVESHLDDSETAHHGVPPDLALPELAKRVAEMVELDIQRSV